MVLLMVAWTDVEMVEWRVRKSVDKTAALMDAKKVKK